MKIHKSILLLIETIDNKWIPIYNEIGFDKGTVNCVLCHSYHPSFNKRYKGCCDLACPIKKFTNTDGCGNTPYRDFNFYDSTLRDNYELKMPLNLDPNQIRLMRRTYALKELRFLISLVPKKLRKREWGQYYNFDESILHDIQREIIPKRS